MSKLLFFDIDGTLIECNQGIYAISDDVKEALDKLKENGHDVFLATGRCKCFITDGVMDYPFSGYVTCNGGYVEYLQKPVYKAIVSSEAIKATMELSNKYNFNYYFENSDYIYVRDKNDPRHIQFANNWKMKPETIIDDFDPEQIETYIGMIVVNDKKDIPIMVETLSKYFDVQRHQSDYSFDLTLKGVSKAVGIEKLVERLNRDINDTIAFGDGRNDIEMLETVKVGVAMGNAVPEAKAVADYVTDRIEENGIKKALEQFELI
ncbi:MAG: Cof-type HAD-IIB family hydrolase [Thomasclavelia sp.]